MTMHIVGWNGRVLNVYGSVGSSADNFSISRIEVDDIDITQEFSLAEVSGLEKAIVREIYKGMKE